MRQKPARANRRYEFGERGEDLKCLKSVEKQAAWRMAVRCLGSVGLLISDTNLLSGANEFQKSARVIEAGELMSSWI